MAPLNTGFNARSTSLDVIRGIDLSGKIAIVTGGNSAGGVETTEHWQPRGLLIIVPARGSMEKARKNLASIAANVKLKPLDFMKPASIDGRKIPLASGRPLHLLINNANINGYPLPR